MIDGHCFANLDGFKLVEWPDTFAAVPRIGERVEGRRGGEFPTLRVVGVTHTIVNGAPFIRVELHRQPMAPLLTTEDVAAQFGVHPRTVKRAMARMERVQR